MLLGYVMDVNPKTRAHLETLHMATYQRDSRKMQLLIDRGADVNVLDLYNNSILHLALTSGCDVDILNMLLHNDASLTAENMSEQTAFHHAICLYQEEKARILLSNGSNPNVRDLDGHTPLHSAVASDWISLIFIRDLVDAGADVTTEDHGHRTPFDSIDNLNTETPHRIRNGELCCEKEMQVIELTPRLPETMTATEERVMRLVLESVKSSENRSNVILRPEDACACLLVNRSDTFLEPPGCSHCVTGAESYRLHSIGHMPRTNGEIRMRAKKEPEQ
jgi:hypothetical protein